MRKRILLPLLLVGLAALSGCGGVDSPRQDPQVKGKPISPEAQAQANTLAEVDGLKSQVQRLSAEVEDLNLQIRALTQGDGGQDSATLPELSKRIAKIEANIAQMSSQLGLEVGGGQPGAPGGVQPPAQAGQGAQAAQAGQGAQGDIQPSAPPTAMPQPPVTAQPQIPAKPGARTDVSAAPLINDPAEALYAKGMQLYQAKDYDKAVGVWNDMAKSYPKHALASNAYFWMGEAYFQKGDMGQAVLNYNEVVEKFPKSNKTPSSMLKMGMAFQKLGKKDAARLMYQDLVKKFPDSAEAKRAKSLL